MGLMRSGNIASGAFFVSGAWATISGASAAQVRRILDAEHVSVHEVAAIVYDELNNEFVAFINRGKRYQ